MEPESLLCSKESAIELCPKPDESNPHFHILFLKDLF
jgi:hypothetical protein